MYEESDGTGRPAELQITQRTAAFARHGGRDEMVCLDTHHGPQDDPFTGCNRHFERARQTGDPTRTVLVIRRFATRGAGEKEA